MMNILAMTLLLTAQSPGRSDACGDFGKQVSLPESFHRAGSAMFREDELSWFSNGPCTCTDSPRFNRARSQPGVGGLYWSCHPTATDEKGNP
jgi:hypothetical protein